MKLRNIAFFVLAALSLTAAFLLHNPFGRMPFFILLSLTLLSLLYAVIVKIRFAFIENKAAKACTRGTAFRYRFTLANDTRLPFTHIRAIIFNGHECIHKDFSVMPHQSEDFETDFIFRHIGKYDVGFLTAKAYDLFDLFSIPYNNYRHPVIVEPRIEKLEQFLAVKTSENSKQARFSIFKSAFSGSYDGVREYAPGDSLKSIHWKLTNHTGKYMSRISENTENFAISIYIDLYSPGVEGEEARCVFDTLIETAFAVANYGIEHNGIAEFVYNRKGRLHRNEIASAPTLKFMAGEFALYSYDATCRAEDLLGGGRNERQGYDNIAVCTPNLSYDLAYSIAELRVLGKRPALFYSKPWSKPPDGEDKILEFLDSRGIEVKLIQVSTEGQ